MGDHKINVASKGEEKAKFIQHLLDDIKSLEYMLKERIIEEQPLRIGAEQEFCIVDEDWTPSIKAMEILESINDKHFTTELALYNLELNLDPIELKHDCLRQMMESQLTLLNKAKKACEKFDTKPLLSGILPSISSRHVGMEYMTPSPRYQVLNEMMKKLRGTDFSLRIVGADELTIMHDSVLFEACNTSYQMHLQIEPSDFVSSYNWSQAISGPLLAICANSPMLFGKELWSETRIALFQQSTDTRSPNYSIRQNEPRVTFGTSWISDSIVDIYKDDISQFQLIISKDIKEDSLAKLKNGEIPKLEALSLHNGTIYRWNRACYGVGGGKPHVRIENRYIPAGPTTADEIANLAFWVGLMKGRPKEYDTIHDKMDFKDAKSNFIKAARTGKDSHMVWMGKSIPTSSLVLEILIPLAKLGLEKIGIDNDDIRYFMDIIEKRTLGASGAEWQVKNYRVLKDHLKNDNVGRVLCAEMYKYQQENTPVSEWKDVEITEGYKTDTKATYVHEIMTTQLFTVFEDDPANLVTSLMQWNDIHHVPVENENNELVGILTWQNMKDHLNSDSKDLLKVKDIMVKEVISAKKSDKIEDAKMTMIQNSIGCLPVVKDKELIGIISKKDLNY